MTGRPAVLQAVFPNNVALGPLPSDSSTWSELVDTSTRPTTVRASREWDDESVPSGGTRSYRVKAVNSTGTGPVSNVVTATAMFPEFKLLSANVARQAVLMSTNSLIDPNSKPNKSAFTLKVESSPITIKSVSHPTVNTQLTFGLDTTRTFRPGERVTVSYRRPSTNPLQDIVGVAMTEFTDFPAVNDLPAAAPAAPTNVALSPGVAAGSITLTWDAAWFNGSPITHYEVFIGTGAWSRVDGDAGARRHTFTGLTLGNTHSFGVRAVNGIGNGAARRIEGTVAQSKLAFRLSMNRWGIRRGGEGTKVTLGITGYHRSYPISEPITFNLTWNGNPVNEAPLHADNPTTITIPAGQVSASVTLRAAADSDGADKVYNERVHHPLVATTPDGVFTVQNSDGIAVHDNEPEPAVSLEAPDSVLEGEDFHLTVRMTHRLENDADVRFGFNNPSRYSWNLTGLPDPRVITIPQGDLTATLGPLRKLDNDEKDGVTKVGFLLKKNRDEPWKLHNSGQSIYVDDDETPESERRRDRTTPAIFSGDNNAEEGTASFGFGVSIHPDPAPGQTITVD